MTPPAPALPLEGLVIAGDGATWTVYDATGTILRDGVSSARLPEVVGALVGVPVPDPTADRAQVRALGER